MLNLACNPGASLRIAVVVVTYNRPVELRLVVEGLLAQTRPVDHVIIYDNAGPTPAKEILAEWVGKLDIIHSKVNLGGAGGFARGLSHALEMEADWVWLLDDDAIPQPDALERLLEAIRSLPASAGVVGSAVKEYGEVAIRHRRHFNRWTGWEGPLAQSDYRKMFVEMDTCSFVGFLVRAEAAREIPLPTESFFLAYDDTDYSLRLQDAGWHLWLVPSSVVVHLRSPESRLRRGPFGNKHYFNIRNRLIVKRRYARCSFLATLDGLAYGVLVWLRAGGGDHGNLLFKALLDGLAGRLGRLPGRQGVRKASVHSEKLITSYLSSLGTVIIRTQGKRPELLLEAIDSVHRQTIPMSIVLVIHGDSQTFSSVTQLVRSKSAGSAVFLHAPDISRNRGYPLNLALNHLYDQAASPDFIVFLDDDDILYPRFGTGMMQGFSDPAIDVVYSASQKRQMGHEAQSAYHVLPQACLLVENFIPINAYAVRFESLKRARLAFDENLEVLEDWNFLHRMLHQGFRFGPLPECLSEFRLTGDGNTCVKQDQNKWDRAWSGVQEFLEKNWQSLDGDEVVSSFYAFDFSIRPALSSDEKTRLMDTVSLLWRRFPHQMKSIDIQPINSGLSVSNRSNRFPKFPAP